MQTTLVDNEKFQRRIIPSHLGVKRELWINYEEIRLSEQLYEYEQPKTYVSSPMERKVNGNDRKYMAGKTSTLSMSCPTVNEKWAVRRPTLSVEVINGYYYRKEKEERR